MSKLTLLLADSVPTAGKIWISSDYVQEFRESLIGYLAQFDQMMSLARLKETLDQLNPYMSGEAERTLGKLTEKMLTVFPRYYTVGLLRDQLIYDCAIPFGNKIQPLSVQLRKMSKEAWFPWRRRTLSKFAAMAQQLEQKPRVRIKALSKQI